MTTEHPAVRLLALALGIALAGCARQPTPASSAPATPALAQAGPAAAQAVPRTAQAAWTLPAQAGMQPDLAVAPDGALLLSWVEESAGQRSLHMARSQGDAWSRASTVARGDWFGNSFDTPQIEQTADGALWVTWMRSSPSGGHARDVVIARSVDGGATWSAPVPVNTDGTATEHGFVSLWRAAPDAIGVAWLDGRAKAGETRGHDEAGGPMQMLRTATFDAGLRRHGEATVDSTVCDCCHTAVAVATDGPVLVYRDRTPAEVRDIHVALLRGGAWRDTGAVHDDHWVMPGCPVNGPSVAASGNRVAAAWYTSPGGVPSVHYALSTDGGAHFAAPATLAREPGVLGRVAASTDNAGAWFGWVAESGGAQVVRVARRDWAAADTGPTLTLATLHTHGQGAGMPRLATANGATYAVWTDTVDGAPHLVGKRF